MLQTSDLFNDCDPDTQLAEGLWVSSLKLMSFKSPGGPITFLGYREWQTPSLREAKVSVLDIFSAIFHSTLILEKESTKLQLVFSCSRCRSFRPSGPQTRITSPMVGSLSLYQKTFQRIQTSLWRTMKVKKTTDNNKTTLPQDLFWLGKTSN